MVHLVFKFFIMDIIAFRFNLSGGIKRSAPEVFENPLLVKPSPFLSVRDIVARYSRGEVVFKPEQLIETPQDDDTIKHYDPIKSDLDYAQRIKDKHSYLNQLDLDHGKETTENEPKQTDVDSNIDTVSKSS